MCIRDRPDTEPPTVKIAEPADGSKFDSGATVPVVSEVHDNYGGVGWKMVVKKDGELLIEDIAYKGAQTWSLAKIPDGYYEVSIEAEDHADHIVTETVTFTVGAVEGGSDSAGTPTTSDTDPSGGGESSGGSSGGADEGSSGSDGVGTNNDDGGCRISPREGAPLGLLAPLVGLGLAWRARRRQR